MPINYKDYSDNWKEISEYIRFVRADNKCEVCGLPNYAHVNKHTRECCLPDEDDAIRIILTVAHLDHDLSNNNYHLTDCNNKDNNLKALCQKCHLSYDAKHHAETRRKNKEKNQLKLEL